MDWKRIAASVLLLGVLALPASAASITPQTTMKEIRDDPDIKASGLYTYTYVWERDCEKLSTSRDDETLTEVVGKTSAEACAAGLNYLAQVYHDGTRVTYPLYTDEEIAAVPARAHAELYYCPAQQPGARFAIVLSGNALYYSGELRGGVSTAWELHEQGYAVFSLRYRIGWEAGDDAPLEDLARAITFVSDHAQELQVDLEGYSLWGGSAGGRMAAWLGSYGPAAFGGGDLPRAGAVIMQYPGHSDYTENDPPTFACVGERDGIANWRTMERRLQALSALGIPTEFHHYPGLRHGFGLGTGTVAEGWLDQAVAFWEANTSPSTPQT